MASNGLVANPSKTNLMFINLKQEKDAIEELKVGKVMISQVNNAKLLGMNLDDDLGWKSHIEGKGGIIPSLNSRLFLIKRLRKCVNKDSLKKIADSLFNSKIRYGLQLLGKVRLTDAD